LDYESASATLGKPGGADLSLGLPPVLHSTLGRNIRKCAYRYRGSSNKSVEIVYLSFFVGQFLTHIFILFYHHLRHRISFYVPQVYNARAH
jgi:hypothetical protein